MTSADPEPKSNGGGIQVIARVAQVLRAIKGSPGGLTQAELAAALNLPKTTVFRLLSALEDEQLVASGSGSRGRYRIGPEVGRLASAATRDVVALLRPFIVELSGDLAETVDVSVVDGSRITFVDQVDAPHRLRAASAVGESFPLYTCAPGKAMLAAMTPAQVSAILPTTLPRSTAATITSVADLRRQLAEVRETGIAFDYEEQNDGICAAGIAMTAADTLIAVSIPMPAQRFVGREQECTTALLALRERILAQDWA